MVFSWDFVFNDSSIVISYFRSGKSGHKSYPANISMKSGGSSISYVSAVSTADLLEGDEVDGLFHGVGPLVRPGLLDAYSHYMQPITCINWRQNIPTNLRRKFNLLKNLKVFVFIFVVFLAVGNFM